MGFKMKGSPATRGAISGTAGHTSALKKLAEERAASAFKHWGHPDPDADHSVADHAKENIIDPVKEKAGELYEKGKKWVGDKYDQAKKNIEGVVDEFTPRREDKKKKKSGGSYSDAAKKDPNLADYIAKRKTLEKGSDEWKRNQNKINEAYGVSKRYEVADLLPDSKRVETGDKKVDKISKQQDKVEAKGETKKAEVEENVERKVTRKEVRKMKRQHGKGSQEHLEAKAGREQSRLTDLEGGKGGKKAKFLGNIRRKLSKKRLAKKQKAAGLDENNEKVAE
jgi:hypothetical protein